VNAADAARKAYFNQHVTQAVADFIGFQVQANKK